MAHIVVDGRSYEVEEGRNLLEAVLSHHLDLPYFCWHPALGSVGACRQCAAIEYADEDDERGRLVMACITSVRDGMRFSIEAPHAEDFRKSVIEWLMENHPHDCPVCEEGGECHLQDMTVMTGHASRRYRGTKRTWENQYLGPFIGHEMNRCITCYRCVRFYRDYAGGTDLEAFGSRGRMYFGRAEDGVLESEFAGNLVEVCPTGVFTDRPFSKQYTRKWDLQSAPSICPGCSVGCNIFPSERYGDLKRIHNRYHGDVNGYFLCDRGRFGSHFVNADSRIRHAGVRDADGVFEARGAEAALEAAGAALGVERIIGIGSPRASVEANFALRTLVGEENFCNGLSDREAELAALTLDMHAAGGARIPTLSEVESADAVLVLGEDVSNTAARVALALRQTARGKSLDMASSAGIPGWQDAGIRGHGQHSKSPVFIASALPTRIDDIAAKTLRTTPPDIARAGFAIAHRIDPAFADAASDGSGQQAFIERAASALANAKQPLIVTGAGCADANVLKAAANIAWAVKAQGGDPSLLIAAGEANTMGVAALPGGLSMEAALEAAAGGAADTLVVLENDLYRRADAATVTAALTAASQVILLDALETPTAESASVALPAATYAESTGTFVNHEGRAQRFYRVFEPADDIAPSWEWLARMAAVAGRKDCAWEGIDAVVEACGKAVPALSSIAAVAPAADYRVEAEKKIPRQPHRYSGRTAMRADVNIHEPKTTVDGETPFSYSMEGENTGGQPGSVVPYVWTPGWNSNQSVFKFQQEVGGPLRGGDPGVRLLDADGADEDRSARFRDAPPPAITNGGYRLVPSHAIFGSEELSARSWPILERRPAPYLVLHPADAVAVGAAEGTGARCPELGASFIVRTDEAMTPGTAAVVVGYPEAPGPLPTDAVELVPDPDFVAVTGDPNVIARG